MSGGPLVSYYYYYFHVGFRWRLISNEFGGGGGAEWECGN